VSQSSVNETHREEEGEEENTTREPKIDFSRTNVPGNDDLPTTTTTTTEYEYYDEDEEATTAPPKARDNAAAGSEGNTL
jgi:hypothetical protein